ncbi:MAG: endonuclease/exonuclease/phosphatase family protein [Alphaproteobacteria bacterium]|nr:endonuclease/exonuclease/phosphatase family protein [Alphaproteobacteria bacterium]
MKLITWNIQFGLGVDGRNDVARIIAEARRIADFDVLCLQEVADNFPHLKGSRGENQFAAIARLLPGYTAIEGAAVDVPAPEGRRRRFGNLLLSRLPVGQVLRHALPWEADATKSMPRLLIEAVVSAPFGLLRVMTTHLEFYSTRQRAAQVEGIRDAHRQTCARTVRPPMPSDNMFEPYPVAASAILTADFNMRSSDPSYTRLSAPFDGGAPRFVDAWTLRHPGEPHPMSFCVHDQRYDQPHCCDFIFVTEDLAPRVTRIVYDTETQVSDHQPVLVELQD